MKKAFISAAAFAVVAVSAIAVAPTTSEAIPAFARQTGAACLSCHFQSFPALNAFGRAFKLGALTDVGDEALIEDDNLSLPAVLNLGMVLRPQYMHTRATTGAVSTNTTTWVVPGDSNILLAGRVGTNTGAFVEFNAGAGNFQFMNSFDFDSFKAGLNISGTSFGPTAALELTSVYGQHSGKLAGGDVSAINKIIVGAANSGNSADTSVALWGSNGLITVQVAGVVVGANLSGNTTVTNASMVPMVALTLDTEIGGFAAVAEIGTMNGTQSVGGSINTQTVKATWLAAQLQGDLGDMSLGIYADFATTKSGAFGNYATSTGAGTVAIMAKKDGYSIRAELEPIPSLLLGVGFGSTKQTPVAGPTPTKITSVHYAVTYTMYQNMEVTLSETDDSTSGPVAVNGDKNKSTLVEILAVF